MRFHSNQERDEALDKARAICERVETPGTHCTLGPLMGFPAMEKTPKTDALVSLYQDASEALGMGRPGTASTAGCSDSAFTTSMGIPTLCAVGVLGEGQHSPNEHALEESLLTRPASGSPPPSCPCPTTFERRPSHASRLFPGPKLSGWLPR